MSKCICRLDSSVCNNKQYWNKDKCMCECKELINKGACGKEFIWNPGNCECECNKSCDIGEYLDYSNCKCRRKFVGKLIEECTKSIDEVEITQAENEHENKCSSCTLYIVLFSIFFAISIGIATCFAYFYWYLTRSLPKAFQTLDLSCI